MIRMISSRSFLSVSPVFFWLAYQFSLFSRVDSRLDSHYFDWLGNHWMGYADAHTISFSLLWNFSAKKETAFLPQPITSSVSFSAPIVSSVAVTPTSINVSEDVMHRHVERLLSEVIAES